MIEIKLPLTRYYGSKRKLIRKIWQEIENSGVEFDSVLDIFGGSGISSYFFKIKGKTVIYNDIFTFNYFIGKALVGNKKLELTYEELHNLFIKSNDIFYDNIIERNFDGIYFNNDENKIIDIVVQNIEAIENVNKKASAYYILFQSCMIKRPYNIFHRKNLNLRTNFNGGGFGNKVTWERSFEELFYKFYVELENFVFDNDKENLILNTTALNCDIRADLIYIDPPYFSNRTTNTPYHSKYHFLEGLTHYKEIEQNINYNSKHKEIFINKSNEFEDKKYFLTDLDNLISKHSKSIIVISYRNNGYPSIPDIEKLVKLYKSHTLVIDLGNYNYALNKDNKNNSEFLIIGY